MPFFHINIENSGRFCLKCQKKYNALIIWFSQESLNKKEMQPNFCNVNSMFIFNERYLFG